MEADLATIPQDRLTPENRVNFAVYNGQIDALLAAQRFREWQKPANSDSSFWGDLASVDDKPLRSEQEYRNYLSELSEVPRYFDQQIANMQAGEARGFTPPKVTLEGRDASIATIAEAKRAEDTSFWAPFKTMPANIPADRQEALRAEARQAIMARRRARLCQAARLLAQRLCAARQPRAGGREAARRRRPITAPRSASSPRSI